MMSSSSWAETTKKTASNNSNLLLSKFPWISYHLHSIIPFNSNIQIYSKENIFFSRKKHKKKNDKGNIICWQSYWVSCCTTRGIKRTQLAIVTLVYNKRCFETSKSRISTGNSQWGIGQWQWAGKTERKENTYKLPMLVSGTSYFEVLVFVLVIVLDGLSPPKPFYSCVCVCTEFLTLLYFQTAYKIYQSGNLYVPHFLLFCIFYYTVTHTHTTFDLSVCANETSTRTIHAIETLTFDFFNSVIHVIRSIQAILPCIFFNCAYSWSPFSW